MFMDTAKDESAEAIPIETQVWQRFFTLILAQYNNSFDNNIDFQKRPYCWLMCVIFKILSIMQALAGCEAAWI